MFTVSVYEHGRWPGPGAAEDRAGGAARNLPVPAGFNYSEVAFMLEEALLPMGRAIQPQALVLQCSVDALDDDTISKLSLSNNALWLVVEKIKELSLRLLVLGGGGYNPWSVAWLWAGVWWPSTATGSRPAHGAPAAEAVLRGLCWNRAPGRVAPERWFTTLEGSPRPGPVSDGVRAVVVAVLTDRPPAAMPSA